MGKIILLLGAILVIGLAFWFQKVEKGKGQPKTTVESFQTQVNSEGAVTVEVRPVNLAKGKEAIFQVSLSTHAVELNYDLKELSFLIDNQGREYKPISYDGGVGGHHLSGTLVFPPLSKNVKSIKLTIKGVANIERTFVWSL